MLQSIINFLHASPVIEGSVIGVFASWLIKVNPNLPHSDVVELLASAIRQLVDAVVGPKPPVA